MKRIFDMWPSLKAMADDLGKPYPTIAAWHFRGSIPGRYDVEIISAAKRRGKSLTFEEIAIERSLSKGAA